MTKMTPELQEEYEEYETACCIVKEIPYSLDGYLKYKDTEHVQSILKEAHENWSDYTCLCGESDSGPYCENCS